MSTLYPTETHLDAQRYYYQPSTVPASPAYVPTPFVPPAQPAYAPTPFVPAQPAATAIASPTTIPENSTTEEGLSIILASTQEYFQNIMTHLKNVDARLTGLEQTTREINSNQRSMLTQAPGPDPREREREDEELARKLQAQYEDERKAAAAVKAEPPKKPAELLADCPFCDAKLPIVEAEAHVQQHMEQEDKKKPAALSQAVPAKPSTPAAVSQVQPTAIPQMAGGYPYMNMPPGFPMNMPPGYMPGQPVLIRAGPNGQLAYAMPQPMMGGTPSGMPQPYGLYPMDPSQAGLQPAPKQ